MKQASLFLKAILEHNQTVTQAVGSRIYPIAAPAGVDTFPFVTFDHSSLPDIGTKDGDVRIITADVTFVSRTAIEAEGLSDSFLPAMYAFYEDETNNTFANDFYEPEFVSESEIYIQDIDAFAVNMKIKFETK